MQQASVILGHGNGDPVLTICMPGGDDGLFRWRGVGVWAEPK
jgi:hypothetical protein